SDKEITKYLTFHRSYHENIVPQLIRDFKETLAFANLPNCGIITERLPESSGIEGDSDNGQDNEWQKPLGNLFSTMFPPPKPGGAEMNAPPTNTTSKLPDPVRHAPPPPTSPDMRPYTLAIGGGRTAYLYVPADISSDDFSFITDGLSLLERSICGTA